MPAEPSIRGYRPSDLAACRALWVELTEQHRQIYDSPEIGGADPGAQFDDHLAAVGPDHLWVAELDGEVVGLTGLIPGDREGELEPAIVAAGHRGRGIGRALTAVVIERARQLGMGALNVRPVARNADAIRFFNEMGFDTLGHVELFMDLGDRPGPWRDGEELGGRRFRI